MLDHLSLSWGNDEIIDLYHAHDVTVQWCTVEESDDQGHTKGAHNFGIISAAEDLVVNQKLLRVHQHPDDVLIGLSDVLLLEVSQQGRHLLRAWLPGEADQVQVADARRMGPAILGELVSAQAADFPEHLSRIKQAATRELDRLLQLLLGYYRGRAITAAETLQLTVSKGDTHHNAGRKLYFHLNNHKSKLALFLDLTPELGRALATTAPEETAVLRRWVALLMPAFYLAFEERSVHYGENFVELPDSVHGLFLAKSFLWDTPAEQLARYTDLPWVRADLFHIEKLVHAIEAEGQRQWVEPRFP